MPVAAITPAQQCTPPQRNFGIIASTAVLLFVAAMTGCGGVGLTHLQATQLQVLTIEQMVELRTPNYRRCGSKRSRRWPRKSFPSIL